MRLGRSALNMFWKTAAVILGTVVCSTAFAERATPEREPVPDEDVSELKGQLVPVGEQERYRYSYPTWNISLNPVGVILGSYGLSASYAPGANVAIRLDLNYYDPIWDKNTDGFEAGLAVPIYFRKVYSGFMIEPGVVVRYLKENSQFGGRSSVTTTGPQMLVGYHWIWDSGLNMAVAAGVGRNFSKKNDYDELFFNGYFRVGYAF